MRKRNVSLSDRLPMKKSPGRRTELQGDAMETATRTQSYDQRPSDALRKKRKKKALKKAKKQDSQFQPELRRKMCSKWCHGTRPQLQREKSRQADEAVHQSSGGQRHSLPSSVIICMLVPLFFSWLNETKGSSLPGLANDDKTALRGDSYWKQVQSQRERETQMRASCQEWD